MNGNRLKHFRKLRGLTQKQLGTLTGYPESSADMRIAQYENGRRTPKSETIKVLSDCLDVDPVALDCPEIGSDLKVILQILFQMEDTFGLSVHEYESNPVLWLDCESELKDMLHEWALKASQLRNGVISREEYDQWRFGKKGVGESERAKK